MIYRIHHNERYLMHVVPPVESMTKLGEQFGTFAFNAQPIPYADIWQPLHIEFAPCEGSKASEIPDISENFGRLYVSHKAHEYLKELLTPHGEFLPVTFKGGEGHLFNPLTTAESLHAINESLTSHDAYGNLNHYGFMEAALGHTPLFKTELDTYKGIFCSDAVKIIYEANQLTGISFHPDLANPIGENYGTSQ